MGASKPAPDMFHAALALTGAKPEEVVHVGDNPEHDVLGALEVGMHAIWINAGDDDWRHEQRPHATIRGISELPRAIDRLLEARARAN